MWTHLYQTQETGGGQEGSRVQLYDDQNRTCFLFPTCVFFPQACSNLQVTQKRGRKKHIYLLIKDEKQGGVTPPHPSIQNKASCSVCLVLFVCVSSNSLGRPCMEGREKDSSLTAFDVHVLWPHVNALSVKSFCCPSA